MRGFTLIEMMVVLAVLALVAGIVLLRGRPRSAAVDMQQASSLVSGTLRAARARSIATNRPVPVRFGAGGTTVQMEGGTLERLPADVHAAQGDAVIVFRPDGSSSGGRVELAAPGRSAWLEVSWLTGRVSTGR